MASVLIACTKNVYQRRIQSYLNASTIEEKEKYMADNYRSFLWIRKIQVMTNLPPIIFSKLGCAFTSWCKNSWPQCCDGVWTIKFNEQNDFSKLIGFPGWKATYLINFNRKGLIQETVPDTSNPSYKKWLQPAVVKWSILKW